jgi:hypothetical protein
MWDFQHAPSRVTGGHPSQHVQQIGDDGIQTIGLGSDTMLEMGLSLTQPKKLAQELRFPLIFINSSSL